jgi:hypothetical protein
MRLTNIRFHERQFSGYVIVTCEQIGRHEEANRQLFQTFIEEEPEVSRYPPARLCIHSNISNWH